jgi:hypothetical protein
MHPLEENYSLKNSLNGGSNKKRKIEKSEPGFPVLREAVSAIYWPALCWLEGDFALFSTV